MYKIIGADQREYGPVSAEQIVQWISEGRLNAQMQARAEGSPDWRPLASFPEFAGALGMGDIGPAGVSPAEPEAAAAQAPGEILARDYDLDLAGCFSRGWELFKSRFGPLFLSFLVLLVTGFVLALFTDYIGSALRLSKLAGGTMAVLGLKLVLSSLVVGPLWGGLYYVYLRNLRGQGASAGEVFVGFHKRFGQLFLGALVTGILIAACMAPFDVIYGPKLQPIAAQFQNASPAAMHTLLPQAMAVFAKAAPVFFLCLIPTVYLSVNWQFTLPLIIDRELDFWPAMVLSWKAVHKHWWHVFGLVILAGLVKLVGLLLCCVGWLFTAPVAIAAILFAYETIFGRKSA